MIINAENNRVIAKNTLYLYLRMGLVMILSLFTTRVLLQVLGVLDYGIYNVVAGFVALFSFMNVSLSASIQRFYNYEGGLHGRSGWQNVYVTSLYIEIIFALIIFILLETIGIWYVKNRLIIPADRLFAAKCLFHLSCVQMILVMLQAPFSAMIMAKERMNYYALVGIVEVVFKLALVLMLPFLSYDKLVVFGVFSTILSVIVFLMYFVYVRVKYTQYRFELKYNGSLFRSMLSFSGWNIWGSTAMIARTQGINVMLNVFWGPVVNAARGVAFQIQSAVLGFTQNLTMAVRPQVTESYAKADFHRTQSLMFSVSKISFILLYLLALPIIFDVDTILKLWLGESVPEYTNKFAILILIASLIDVLNSPVTIVMMASGIIKVYSFITSLIGILILPISYLFLKTGWSPTIVFVIGVFISLSVQVASLFIMDKQLGILVGTYVKKIVIPLFRLVLLTFWIPYVVDFILIGEFANLCVTILLSIFSTMVVSYYVVLDSAERKYLLNFIRR